MQRTYKECALGLRKGLSGGELEICSTPDFSFSKQLTQSFDVFPWCLYFHAKDSLPSPRSLMWRCKKTGGPFPPRLLEARHGLPPRYLETVLQSLARDGILKSLRGPRGGYWLARERHGVTAADILRTAGTVDAAEEEPKSELVVKVVLPVLSAAEQEFGQALSRINLDDMVRHAALNGNRTGRDESGVQPHADL